MCFTPTSAATAGAAPMSGERRILLLRGVNVGGVKLPMAEFRAMLADLGMTRVRTHIQSGNAVFDDPDTADPAPRIGAAMLARFGFLPELFLYTPSGFAAICAQNPFTAEAAADGAKVHAFFLARPATLPAEAAALATTERLHLTDAALFLHAPDGIGRSKLVERLPRLLAVPQTARNWNTVQAILALTDS